MKNNTLRDCTFQACVNNSKLKGHPQNKKNDSVIR